MEYAIRTVAKPPPTDRPWRHAPQPVTGVKFSNPDSFKRLCSLAFKAKSGIELS
jgi:hypothetical protein